MAETKTTTEKKTGGLRAWVKATTERLQLDRSHPAVSAWIACGLGVVFAVGAVLAVRSAGWRDICLLYTSDAADEL